MYENMTQVASRVPVEYRMFYASHTSTTQFDPDLFNKSVLHIGLCFPQSCNQSEAQAMAENIFEKKAHNEFLYLGDINYLGTKTLNIRKNVLKEPFVVLLL